MARDLVFDLASIAAIAAAIAAIAGCGDNARVCGEGTVELNGVCVPGAATACGDGTKLDNGQCVVDPATCQAGTVLIADRCVDPSHGLTVDLEESPEPNGLAIAAGVEPSASSAGTIALAPAGQVFVVHGHLTPFRDVDGDGQLDPDFDTYELTALAPTLLAISVDGVGGAQGAFYAVGDAAGAVPGYERYGLNVTGDTSKRRLFLPAAGLYRIAVSDTRSLSIGKNPPRPAGSGGAAGGPDAEYYLSLTVEPLPTPTPLAVTAGSASHAGSLATDEVELFSAALGAGANDVGLTMPGAAAASIAVVNASAVFYADENPGVGRPKTFADVTVTGIKPADIPVIAVDTVYNYGPEPEPFTLAITTH